MFTGIIEELGKVSALIKGDKSLKENFKLMIGTRGREWKKIRTVKCESAFYALFVTGKEGW